MLSAVSVVSLMCISSTIVTLHAEPMADGFMSVVMRAHTSIRIVMVRGDAAAACWCVAGLQANIMATRNGEACVADPAAKWY